MIYKKMIMHNRFHVTYIIVFIVSWKLILEARYDDWLMYVLSWLLISSPYLIISVLYIWYDTIAKQSSLQIICVVWCIVCCVVFCSDDVLMLYSVALYYCVVLMGFTFRAARRILWIYETRYVNKNVIKKK
jgi:hypothetical protein